MDKLSVIIPVYNAEKYIDRCIQSIIHQSYPNLQIIVIDDGSTDNSLTICQKYAEIDDRILCIHQRNKGVSAARNNGLDHAIGDYVTFVDSDDYIDEEMYDSMLKIANEYTADVVLCDCVKEYLNCSKIYSHPIRAGYYNREDLENEYFNHLIMTENVEYPATISNWLLVMKNKELPRYMEDIKYSEDLLYGAQVLYSATSFYYMKDCPFYHYDCTNINSATHKYHEDKWENYKALYHHTKQCFPDKRFDEQIYKMLLFFVYNTLNDYRYGNVENGRSKAEIVLNEQCVREMFGNLKIFGLPIHLKLKVLTLMYKYQIGLKYLFKDKWSQIN